MTVVRLWGPERSYRRHSIILRARVGLSARRRRRGHHLKTILHDVLSASRPRRRYQLACGRRASVDDVVSGPLGREGREVLKHVTLPLPVLFFVFVVVALDELASPRRLRGRRRASVAKSYCLVAPPPPPPPPPQSLSLSQTSRRNDKAVRLNSPGSRNTSSPDSSSPPVRVRLTRSLGP